jgi:hypothetical protein
MENIHITNIDPNINNLNSIIATCKIPVILYYGRLIDTERYYVIQSLEDKKIIIIDINRKYRPDILMKFYDTNVLNHIIKSQVSEIIVDFSASSHSCLNTTIPELYFELLWNILSEDGILYFKPQEKYNITKIHKPRFNFWQPDFPIKIIDDKKMATHNNHSIDPKWNLEEQWYDYIYSYLKNRTKFSHVEKIKNQKFPYRDTEMLTNIYFKLTK